MLKRYFGHMLIECQTYTRIGGWWDRKGENEIDIMAENKLNNEATFFEVKRKAANIDIEVLKQKQQLFCVPLASSRGMTYPTRHCQWMICSINVTKNATNLVRATITYKFI